MYLVNEESKALRENKACRFKISLYTRVGRKNKLTLGFTSTNHMWASFLTKALPPDKFEVYCENLGLQLFTTNLFMGGCCNNLISLEYIK